MNKKFSTLMAGLMLASAFSVADAQTAKSSYGNGKYYMLGDGTNYLSVESTPGATYGELSMVSPTTWDLESTRQALWKVTVTSASQGNVPKYSFVNVATGMVLSLPTPGSNGDQIGQGTTEPLKISGGYMEWVNGASNSYATGPEYFVSYVNNTDVIYLVYNSGDLYVERNSFNSMNSNALKIQPYEAAIVNLGAEELNKELIMNNREDSFTLSFNRDVTEGAENLFTGVNLVATDVMSGGTSTGYVQLHVKDTKNYLVVDTALHAGSEADRQLPKFAYDDPNKLVVDGNNVKRLPESFNFKFAYDPTNNRVLIKSQAYYTRAYNKNTGSLNVYGAVDGTTNSTGDGNTAYTGWGPNAVNTASWFEQGGKVENAYIRLVELSSVRELTVASKAVDGSYSTSGATEWSKPDDLTYGMLTTVTIGQGLMSYVPTTIPTGLYTIQYKSGNETEAAADNYFVANLGGAFGYAEQAKNQLFDHIPAAQWYVKQVGSVETAPVTITNREFFDNADYDMNSNVLGSDYQYQAFQGPDGSVFFLGGAFANDTLKFIPVSAANKADSLLGYKHVDVEQASVEVYNFNYLHGLSLDNGLNTPSDKDSLVRVDETGEKASFRLVPVVGHDSYGIQLSASDVKNTGIVNLVRNAYYVKAYDNSKFEGERYLTYDKASKKYVMSTTPTPYFLKENNCIDNNHYYALVEADLYYETLADLEAMTSYVDGAGTSFSFNWNNYYAPEYAGKKKADAKSYGEIITALTSTTAQNAYKAATRFYFFDKNGQPIVEDASADVALYAYQLNSEDVVTLQRINDGATAVGYAYMNRSYVAGDNNYSFGEYKTQNYASSRVSVDDNTLDLTNALLNDKWEAEIRVSAFAVEVIDNPLYRRFNGVAPEAYGDAANSPLNLKFFRHNNNARSYTMFVDTAYVRNNTRMPQYLIAVKPEVVEGDTILCDASTHQHATPEEALACEHTQIKVGFTRAMYLFNAQDSVDVKNYDYQGKAAYGAQGYTRLAFKDAVHANDTLYILNPGVTTEDLKASNLKDDKMFAKKIALDNNKHKNVVFQFRLIDEDNNRFLIESEAEQNGAAVLNKDLQNVCVAPMRGGWVKVQNGVPVIARFQDFNEAIAQAEVFDVNDEIKYDATANDEIAVEGVSVVAGNGQVTIMGAAGKNVTITNILGKVIASQVIASDNATIAVPAGIVAVAVEGEAAVKAIVK